MGEGSFMVRPLVVLPYFLCDLLERTKLVRSSLSSLLSCCSDEAIDSGDKGAFLNNGSMWSSRSHDHVILQVTEPRENLPSSQNINECFRPHHLLFLTLGRATERKWNVFCFTQSAALPVESSSILLVFFKLLSF